jgi:hypothetical protein
MFIMSQPPRPACGKAAENSRGGVAPVAFAHTHARAIPDSANLADLLGSNDQRKQKIGGGPCEWAISPYIFIKARSAGCGAGRGRKLKGDQDAMRPDRAQENPREVGQ